MPGGEAALVAWRQLGLGVLSQVVPVGLVDEAVAVAGVGQQRVRLLPSRVVVTFVLAMAVFSAVGYRQVWRQLVSGWPGLRGVTPTRSAFTKARRRVGVAPLAWLFTQVRGCQGVAGMAGVLAFGLRLVAWDGTTMSVPDSAANRAGFGRIRGGRAVADGFPRVRLLALVECGTRAVVDAVFGRESEQDLAARVVASLGPGMLLLADRNFSGYLLWAQVRARGAQLLWRAGAHRVLPVLRRLPDGSWLSQIEPPALARKAGAAPIKVRVVRYRVTVATTGPDGTVTTRTETYRLITSLLDPVLAPARGLADCYHERWEIETGFRELKTWLRGRSVVLRSQDPDGVQQELWAYLIVYQTLRHLITTTAAEVRIDTDQLSFVTGLRATQLTIINTAIVGARQHSAALTRFADHLLDDEIPTSPPRTTPRVVRQPVKPYKAKKPNMTSTHANYHLDIRNPIAKENT